MQFTWDETKRRKNIAKHRIDFRDCPVVFEGPYLSLELNLEAVTERRHMAVGFIGQRVVSVIHTWDTERIHIISARKATRHEESYLRQALGNGLGSPGPDGGRRH